LRALLSVATGILFGLLPALRASSPDLLSSLKHTGRGGGSSSRRLRSALVVVEVALALVLVAGAGLMIRSFVKLMAVPTGFDPEGVVTMRLTLPPAKYADVPRWLAFHDELVRRVAAIAGVSAAGINSAVPLEGGGSEAGVLAEGQPIPLPGQVSTVTLFQAASPDYFRADGHPAGARTVVHGQRQPVRAARGHRRRVAGAPAVSERRRARQARRVRVPPRSGQPGSRMA
jgi:hypothetical protein